MRVDGRRADRMRPVYFTRQFTKHAEGSVLTEMGDTMVLCNATVGQRLPKWRQGSGAGWVTAEYDMLPRATRQRSARRALTGRPAGRSLEIQRLIGRALRAVIDLEALGEHSITLDCDVLQADGGTRTAAITGAFVALVDALAHLQEKGALRRLPVNDYVAAVSVGKTPEKFLLDLDQDEDSSVQVDLNVVATGRQQLVEVQGAAEAGLFSRQDLNDMIDLALTGTQALVALQKEALGPLADQIQP